MAVLTNTMLQGASAASDAAGDYLIKQSLKFNKSGGDNPDLRMMTRGKGNRKLFTIAWWQKDSLFQKDNDIWTGGSATGHGIIIRPNYDPSGSSPTGKLFIGEYISSWDWYFNTDRVFRDTASWQHFCVIFDSAQSTNTERVRLFVNGRREFPANFTVNSWPSENHEFSWNITVTPVCLGGLWNDGVSVRHDGLVADAYHIDSLAVPPSAFGSFNSAGVWNPKDLAFATPNDGRTWSTGGESGSFDGSLSNGPTLGQSYTTICTNLEVTVNQEFRIEGNWSGASATLTIELDVVEYTPTRTLGLWEYFNQYQVY